MTFISKTMVQNWIDELWSQNNYLDIINDIHVKIFVKPMKNVIARWSVAPGVETASPITSTFAEPFNLTMISSSTNYQLQIAKIIQYHPVSSSVFQLPIICMYIYIYTYIIYTVYTVFVCIYIYTHTCHWQLMYQLPIKYTSYNEATCDGRMHRACRRW